MDYDEQNRIVSEIDRAGLSTDPFAAAMRATRMPMIITDPNKPDNPIVFMNDAFCKMTGYSRDEVINRNCRFLQGPNTSKEDVARLRQAIGDQVTIELELLNYKKNGEEFWNRLLVAPVFDANGELTYFTASQYDTTLERYAHKTMQELNDTLESRVARALSERSKTEDQLRQSQKMEAVGQLTGGVAHDFNNLLTVIRGSADLLRRPNISDDRRKQYVDAIVDTAERAAKLTNQLLAFARRQALIPVRFDAVESIRNVQAMLGTLLGARMTITLDLRKEPCYVDADRSQFDTAIVNMAANARDAMGGEGNLLIKVDAVTVMPANRSHPAVAGQFASISLTDRGMGIAKNQIDRIFEPFFTTKKVGEGTGLGLSQVFGFAKQSGGDIHVNSVKGEGTTFTLYLPLAAKPENTLDEDAKGETYTLGKGACILVVEDNAEVGAFATHALTELGYKVILAKDGSEALAVLDQPGNGNVDVVFSDVVMPGMSGIELGLEIRRLYAGLPVILTSGYSNALADKGSHGFELLRKPYAIDELSRILRKVADQRSVSLEPSHR